MLDLGIVNIELCTCPDVVFQMKDLKKLKICILGGGNIGQAMAIGFEPMKDVRFLD